MELRQLKVFVAVLEAGSFTAAASRLGYVQSSVSANIQALEHELGVPLFDRIGHRVLPTSAARRLEATVRPVLAALDVAARQATNPEPSGLVVLGTAETPATYRLPPVIGELARRFPALEVVLRPGSCDAHRAALRRGEMDAAVLLHDGQEAPEFEVWPLWQEEVLLVASPCHPAANPLLSTADLAVYPYLATEPGTYRAAWEARCETAGVKIRVVELVQVELIKRCVEAGLGFSILPAVAVEDEVRAGRLSARPLPDARLIMTTSLVRLRDRWRPPALDALIAQLLAAAGKAGSLAGHFPSPAAAP